MDRLPSALSMSSPAATPTKNVARANRYEAGAAVKVRVDEKSSVWGTVRMYSCAPGPAKKVVPPVYAAPGVSTSTKEGDSVSIMLTRSGACGVAVYCKYV